MCHEVVGHLRDPVTDFLPAERHRLADDVGVKLFALGNHRGQGRCADGAAEIAQHVADARCRGHVLWRDVSGGHRGEWCEHHSLADSAHNIRNPELVTGIVGRHGCIHEAAIGKDGKPNDGDVTGVKSLHQSRHERDQDELRQPRPGQYRTDLFGIIALRLPKIGRQDVNRAKQREPQQRHGDGAETEVSARQQPQPDQRLFDGQLDPYERCQADKCYGGEAQNE